MIRGRLRDKSECMSIQFILNEGVFLMQKKKKEQGYITNILTIFSACFVIQLVEDQRS